MIRDPDDFDPGGIDDPRHRKVISAVVAALPSEDLGIELLIPMIRGAISRPPVELAETPEEAYAREDRGDAYLGKLRAEIKHLVGTAFSPGHWPYPHFFLFAPEKWAAAKVKPFVLLTLSADLQAFAVVWANTADRWYTTSAAIPNGGVRTRQQRLCCPLDLIQFYPLPEELRNQYFDIIPPHYLH